MTKLTYTSRVLPMFGVSLLIAAAGAFIGTQYIGYIANPAVMLVLAITEFILLGASIFARRSRDAGGMLLFSFVFISGLLIAPAITIYVAVDGGSIVFQALLITAIVFGALSFYAYKTGNSFSRLGGFLFVGLIGLIITSLVNIFLRNSVVFLVVDLFSILIFSGYVLYDMGRILNDFSDNDVYSAVLSLYIDFLNLFLNILELLGIFERKD